MISQEVWADYLPGTVPDGCTYEQFCIARDMVEKEQAVEWNVNHIKQCKELHDTTKSEDTKQLMSQLIAISVKEIRNA